MLCILCFYRSVHWLRAQRTEALKFVQTCNAHRDVWILSGDHIGMQAEMRQGLSYFHSTIFTSLPLFYRRIDTALKQVRCKSKISWSGLAAHLMSQSQLRAHARVAC